MAGGALPSKVIYRFNGFMAKNTINETIMIKVCIFPTFTGCMAN
jgi:hypothetical protein